MAVSLLLVLKIIGSVLVILSGRLQDSLMTSIKKLMAIQL